VAELPPIRPLFTLSNDSKQMGQPIIAFTRDDYNKGLGSVLIDAKDDAQAISSFLAEYKHSPETLRSYAKEVERLLLWCIYVAKVNISSLRRNHFLQYQDFLKHPTPKKFGVVLMLADKIKMDLLMKIGDRSLKD